MNVKTAPTMMPPVVSEFGDDLRTAVMSATRPLAKNENPKSIPQPNKIRLGPPGTGVAAVDGIHQWYDLAPGTAFREHCRHDEVPDRHSRRRPRCRDHESRQSLLPAGRLHEARSRELLPRGGRGGVARD